MERPLDAELKKLKGSLSGMADFVENTVEKSIRTFISKDHDAAKRIIEKDDVINGYDLEIEKECLKLIALHQPAAQDLRTITMILQIRSDLERMGDLAVNISEETLKLENDNTNSMNDLKMLSKKTIRMLKDSISSFLEKDARLAKKVWESDVKIDNLNEKIIDDAINYMILKKKKIKNMTSLISVSKCLERIADHATNIAEDVIYMCTGETIMHSDSIGNDE